MVTRRRRKGLFHRFWQGFDGAVVRVFGASPASPEVRGFRSQAAPQKNRTGRSNLDPKKLEALREIAFACLADEGVKAIPLEDLQNVRLLGSGAVLDSVTLVAFLVGFEERVNDRFRAGIVLMDERAMSQTRSPFRNLEALLGFTAQLLEKNGEKPT